MKVKWLVRAGLALGATTAFAWVAVMVMASVRRRHDQEVATGRANRLAGQMARANDLEQAIGELEDEGEVFVERREATRHALSQARIFLANGNLPIGQSYLDDVEGMLRELTPQSDESAAEAAQE